MRRQLFEWFSCVGQGREEMASGESREGCLVLRQQIRITEELMKGASKNAKRQPQQVKTSDKPRDVL